MQLGIVRNGKSCKTLKGEFPIEVPRNREGGFEPQLIQKHQTRWTGFDDNIIITVLKNRSVQDRFIACVDDLKGFPEAIETPYHKAAVQLCIVHMVRNSSNYVGWDKREQVAADLKRVYGAATEAEA